MESDILRLRKQMRKKYLLPIICFVILCVGCRRNEFKVELKLPSDINTTYPAVYYASDSRGGLTIETVISVTAGKGTLDGKTKEPAVVMIFDGPARNPAVVLYVSRGDKIRIKGDSKDIYKWEVRGNRLSEELSGWRVMNSSVLSSNDGKKINKVIEETVRKNPGDELSALLIALYYDSTLPDSDISKQISSLEGKAKDLNITRLTGRQISGKIKYGDKKESPVIIETGESKCDTLRFGGGDPVMILCRSFSDRGDKDLLDTLRRMAVHSKDVRKGKTVDLYLSTESYSWLDNLRRDSMVGVLRGRIAREYSDPDMMRFGVEKTPWIIIVDGNGKCRYSGPDIAKGTALYRKLTLKQK